MTKEVMTSSAQFQLGVVRTTISTARRSRIKTSTVIAAVMKGHADRFDSIQAIPIPDHAPDGMPRAILESTDHHWRIEVYPFRIVAAWGAMGSPMAEQVVEEVLAPLLGFLEAPNAPPVGRLALVTRRVAHCESAPIDLIQRFCKPECSDEQYPAAPLRHSKAFAIHNLKTYDFQEIGTVHSWMRIRSTRLKDNQQPVIEVEQDFSTCTDVDPGIYSVDQIRGFFGNAPAELRKILTKYFPE